MDPPEKAAAVTTTPGKEEKPPPTTLLDVREVEWVTRELERLLSREQSGGADGRRRRTRATAAKKEGFLAELLGRHAVSICSGDTVRSSAVAAPGDRGRRRGGWGSFREVEKE